MGQGGNRPSHRSFRGTWGPRSWPRYSCRRGSDSWEPGGTRSVQCRAPRRGRSPWGWRWSAPWSRADTPGGTTACKGSASRRSETERCVRDFYWQISPQVNDRCLFFWSSLWLSWLERCFRRCVVMTVAASSPDPSSTFTSIEIHYNRFMESLHVFNGGWYGW